MKKRSLFAAVAMLLVSAILLTGSTYAWFIKGQSAYVDLVKAKVTGDDESSVQVALNQNNAQWVTSLADTDLGYSGNTTVPVLDFNPKTNATSAWVADYDGSNFDVREATASEFNGMLKYSFKVRAIGGTSSQNIKIPVSFNAGSPAAICGAITLDNDSTASYIFGPSGGYSMVNTVDSAIDVIPASNNGKGIIDATNDSITYKTGESALTAVTMDTNTYILLSADSVHTIYVTIWAEGQAPACTGSLNIEDCGFTFGSTSDPITLV